ncbi:MAG: glycosyltransferase family 2 protein [Flavobacteriales bacterium]
MMNEPLVSILMPAFNAERFVFEAVESVLNQSHQNWELLILNDSSTDKTISIIESFNDPRITLINQEENRGCLESCNHLFSIAKGEFVTFLDADDTHHPERIMKCLNAFKSNDTLDFITTNFTRFNEQNNLVSEHISKVDYSKYASIPSYQPIVCCATIFLRRNLLNTVGGYHPFFKEIGGEDYHWLFELSRNGKGAHLEEMLYQYRTHNDQTHHLNENPLKYFASDILTEIKTSVIAKDISPLQDESSLKSWWLDYIKSNTAELEFRKASSMLNRNEFKKSITHNFLGLMKNPTSFTSWHRFSYLTYSILVRWAS